MRDSRKYLFDILQSIKALDVHLKDINTFNSYCSNLTVQRAVERELEVIGEAMNQLIAIWPDVPISDTKKIVAMRNRIIHGYDSLDNAVVWNVIKKNIPILKKEVLKLLQ